MLDPMVQIPRSFDQHVCAATRLASPGLATPGSLRVLLVDASLLYGKALSDALGRIPGVEIVGHARQVGDVMPAVSRLRPDLVILDLAFGQTGAGRGLLQDLTGLARAPKVIVLTDDSSALVSAHVLATGAYAHFDKSLATAALIKQVTHLAQRDG